MLWKIRYSSQVIKRVKKLDPVARQRIRKFIENRLAHMEAPKELGTQLVGRSEIWRFRAGDYRILCTIEDEIITITVLDIDHRSKIYKRS